MTFWNQLCFETNFISIHQHARIFRSLLGSLARMFPVWPQRGHFPVQVVAASRGAGRGADAAQAPSKGLVVYVKVIHITRVWVILVGVAPHGHTLLCVFKGSPTL